MEIGNYPLHDAMIKAGIVVGTLDWEEQIKKSIKVQLDSIKDPTDSILLNSLKQILTKPLEMEVELKSDVTSIQISSSTLFNDLGFEFGSEGSEKVFVASGWSFLPVYEFLKLLNKKLLQGRKLQAVLKKCRNGVATISITNLEYI